MADTAPAVTHGEHVYGLASPLTVEEIAARVQDEGSVQAVAEALRLEPAVVRAAVDAHFAPLAAEPPARQKVLETIRDFIAVAAGTGVLVYLLGGLVLAARLAYEDLPTQAVFGQLSRDVFLSIGISQVLVPAAFVVGAHLFGRAFGLLRDRTLGAKRTGTCAAVVWAALLLAAVIRAIVTSGGPEGEDWLFWTVVPLSLGAAATVAALVRLRYEQRRLRWPRRVPWLVLTLAYGALAMVAAAVIAATQPLPHALACSSTGFREVGAFVGHSANHVFLGELVDRERQIVVLPSDTVEELFVGPDAELSICDPRGDAAAVVAKRESVNAARSAGRVYMHAEQIAAARDAETALAAGDRLLDAAGPAVGAVGTAADAADSINAHINRFDPLGVRARDLDALSNKANAAAEDLSFRLFLLGESGDNPDSARLTQRARRLARELCNAADAALRLGDEAVNYVAGGVREARPAVPAPACPP